MKTSLPEHYGFVVRRYECDADMMNYAEIETPICESVEEVVDQVIDYLKDYLDQTDEKPLSEKAWKKIGKRIDKMATPEGWTIEPNSFPELGSRILPHSIKVDYIPLSDRLVRLVKKRIDPKAGIIPHVFEYDPFMAYFRGPHGEYPDAPPEYHNALEAFRGGEAIHLFKNGVPYASVVKTKSGYSECPYSTPLPQKPRKADR